jgi:hypothetical protein
MRLSFTTSLVVADDPFTFAGYPKRRQKSTPNVKEHPVCCLPAVGKIAEIEDGMQ